MRKEDFSRKASMLYLKIALTGLIAAAVFGGIIAIIGKPMPHPAIALILMAGFVAGVAATLGGSLLAIWM